MVDSQESLLSVSRVDGPGRWSPVRVVTRWTRREDRPPSPCVPCSVFRVLSTVCFDRRQAGESKVGEVRRPEVDAAHGADAARAKAMLDGLESATGAPQLPYDLVPLTDDAPWRAAARARHFSDFGLQTFHTLPTSAGPGFRVG